MQAALHEQTGISEFQLALRFRQSPRTIADWRINQPHRVPPSYQVGLSYRYLISEIEDFEDAQGDLQCQTLTRL